MNCKQGDLAVIVRSVAGNEGRIVQCLAFVGRVAGEFGNDLWQVDRDLVGTIWTSPYVRDSSMKPIRDQPGADETLTWAPVPKVAPQPVTEAA